MPPPPPPPPPNMKPMAPPQASSKSSAPSSGSGDGRNMLLESIRQGKTLKKTVVNDRSGPTIQTSKASPASQPRATGAGGTNGTRSQVTAPPGLAGLFAGGMPKLKPVGGAKTPNQQSPQKMYPPEPPPASQKSFPPEPPPASHKTFPPEPPPSSHKPTMTHYVSEEHVPQERKHSIGKPSVAPKPPALHGKGPRPNPPPKLPGLFIPPPPPEEVAPDYDVEPPSPPAGVNRAQSMRLPRSTSPTQTHGVPIEYRTMGRAAGKSVTPQPPPPPRNFQNQNGPLQRPRNSIIRPPSARPPPPPNKIPPAHPPPPPPAPNTNTNSPLPPPPPPIANFPPPTPPPNNNALPPPPPPHRGMPPPPVNNGNGNLGPPPPPTRNSSIRNAVPQLSSVPSMERSGGVDLEARFRHLFTPIENLPKPEQFTGFAKTYPSKIAQSQKRQPAPPIPTTQVQLGHKMWVNNSSAC